MDKKNEIFIILITSIFLVFTLYMFRSIIPTVKDSKETGHYQIERSISELG
ncbi:hypothetical protein [Siminovitchia acidinfaciens]|uniref:hypothetical protein n=1 Tax=Siminovitchia acidinfaciens TaxID=2321395 RepID=UPI0013DE898E|nr:hypothetical protein [Siminovitchia acidinfaciens]